MVTDVGQGATGFWSVEARGAVKTHSLALCQRMLGPGCHGAGTEKCCSGPYGRVLECVRAKASNQLDTEGSPCLSDVCSPVSKGAHKIHNVEIVYRVRSQ